MALPLWASQVWQRQPDVQALISARNAQDARTQQAIFAGLEMQMKQQELAAQQRQFQESMAFKQEQEKNAMQTKAWEMEMAQKNAARQSLVDAANIARYNAMTANYNRQNQPAQPIQPPVSNWPTTSNPDSTITKVAQPETFTPTVSNPTDLNSGSPPSAEDVLAGANPQFTIQGGLQPTGTARESIAGETPYTPIPALMNPAPLQPIPQPPTVFAPINQKPELTDAAIGFNTLTGNSNVPNAKQGQPGNPTDLLSLPENKPFVNAGGLMTMRLPGNKISYSEIDTNKDGTYKLDASGNYVPKNWSVPQDIVPKTTQTNEDKLALLDAKTTQTNEDKLALLDAKTARALAAKIGSDVAALKSYRDALQADPKISDAQKKNMDGIVSDLEKSEKGFNLYTARQSLLDIASQARGDLKTAAADQKTASKIGSDKLKLAQKTLNSHVAELQKRLDKLKSPQGVLMADRDKQIADITAALVVKKSALTEIEKQLAIPTEATPPTSQPGTSKPAMSVDDIAKKYYQ